MDFLVPVPELPLAGYSRGPRRRSMASIWWPRLLCRGSSFSATRGRGCRARSPRPSAVKDKCRNNRRRASGRWGYSPPCRTPSCQRGSGQGWRGSGQAPSSPGRAAGSAPPRPSTQTGEGANVARRMIGQGATRGELENVQPVTPEAVKPRVLGELRGAGADIHHLQPVGHVGHDRGRPGERLPSRNRPPLFASSQTPPGVVAKRQRHTAARGGR